MGLFALLFSVLAGAWGSERIVGGTPVETKDPIAASTVALMWEDVLVCSGTVVDYNLVLTAAHCLGDPKEVAFGIDAGSPEAPRRKITAVLPHPDFDLSRYGEDPVPRHLSDIAVLRFEGGLPPGARPALLADDATPFKTGDRLAIAGFGVDNAHAETGEGPLRVARVFVKDAAYDVSEFQIDASQGAGDCSGDSGGPAFLLGEGPLHVLGVDNWGEGLCDRFGVYARVSFHRAWIEQAMAALRGGQGRLKQSELIRHVPALPILKSRRGLSRIHFKNE